MTDIGSRLASLIVITLPPPESAAVNAVVLMYAHVLGFQPFSLPE
jgi:hypothetical protein